MGKKFNGLAEAKRSKDTLFKGKLHCLQHLEGYRFSIDPVLLAHFVRLHKEERILDLGAGCGVLGLILLYRFKHLISSLTALELQTGLADLARDNCELNQFQGQLQVVEGDLRNINNLLDPESFSTVVCNPPFYTVGSGRVSQNIENEIARHQINATLLEIVAAAALAVKNRGRVYMVYPADGISGLLLMLEKKRLRVKKLQFVYSYPDPSMNARLVLIEAVKNGGAGVDILNPLYIYTEKNGAYSEAVSRFYAPD